MLTIDPPPAALSAGIAAWIPLKTPVRLIGDDLVPVRAAVLVYRPIVRDAGVVHQDVERAVRLHRARDRRFPVFRLRHVEVDVLRRRAERRRQRLSVPVQHVADDDLRAFSDHRSRDRRPDAASATGHQHNFSIESRHENSFCLLNSENETFRTSARSDRASAFSPGANRYSPPLTLTKVGRSNRNGRLAPGTDSLRALAADTVDRVLLARIEADELPALHPFLLDELELPLDVGLDEQVDQAAIDAVVLERTLREMRAVLDATPEQPVPLHRCGAFEWRRSRVAPAQVRAEWASPALIVAGIGEVVAALRIRRDRGIVLVGRQIDGAPAAASAP